jgi:hypothetical protein
LPRGGAEAEGLRLAVFLDLGAFVFLSGTLFELEATGWDIILGLRTRVSA